MSLAGTVESIAKHLKALFLKKLFRITPMHNPYRSTTHPSLERRIHSPSISVALGPPKFPRYKSHKFHGCTDHHGSSGAKVTMFSPKGYSRVAGFHGCQGSSVPRFEGFNDRGSKGASIAGLQRFQMVILTV